jgi:nitrate/nitrite transporter NarK
VAFLTVFVIAVFGIWADTARLPRPIYPLFFAIVIVACYGVLYSFPNTGGVYAATCIAQAVAQSWYPLMWPWRVQTTKHATGSAFAIGFVNSYGQIGGAVSPWLFQSKYAPKYGVSFGTAMGMELACMVMIVVTWWVTWDTEKATRKIKIARVEAGKQGNAVLEDVEIDEKR